VRRLTKRLSPFTICLPLLLGTLGSTQIYLGLREVTIVLGKHYKRKMLVQWCSTFRPDDPGGKREQNNRHFLGQDYVTRPIAWGQLSARAILELRYMVAGPCGNCRLVVQSILVNRCDSRRDFCTGNLTF